MCGSAISQVEKWYRFLESLPPYLLEEVEDYIDFIQFKRVTINNEQINNITLASQDSLSKDWIKPEEDEAWEDL